jgi:circadian clock protein KaiC
MAKVTKKQIPSKPLPKSRTGIHGLDEILNGGLPKGRPTLVCGAAGCGKTILAVEFLVRGATEFNEPGVFVSFDERDDELCQNALSMGFDLLTLSSRKKIVLESVRVEPSEIEECGEYDLEGLFIRLGNAIDSIGAKRVVLDTLESLFSGLRNGSVLRAELRRLFEWLKNRGVTAIVTAESGVGTLTRNGIDEYVADCVILLDHRIEDEHSVRRLRVIKYRGTLHGTDEFPFIVGTAGFSVLPLSSLKQDHKASNQRVSTGIPRLDAMLGGEGFFRGTSILLSGCAGAGKSSLAAHFVNAACERGERAFYMASEQSSAEVVRNMRSIGLDLEPWVKQGLLKFYASRPGACGLERHLFALHELVLDFKPQIVVIDAVTNFSAAGNELEVKSMVTRLIDLLKSMETTAMFTSLTSGDGASQQSGVGVSSQVDCWLLLRNIEANGERSRGLYVLKSRGMAHSNQIREFNLTDHGLELLDVYVGPGGMLTGAARFVQETRETQESEERRQRLVRTKLDLEQKAANLAQAIARMQAEFALEKQRVLGETAIVEEQERRVELNRSQMANIRRADVAKGNGHTKERVPRS